MKAIHGLIFNWTLCIVLHNPDEQVEYSIIYDLFIINVWLNVHETPAWPMIIYLFLQSLLAFIQFTCISSTINQNHFHSLVRCLFWHDIIHTVLNIITLHYTSFLYSLSPSYSISSVQLSLVTAGAAWPSALPRLLEVRTPRSTSTPGRRGWWRRWGYYHFKQTGGHGDSKY